MLHASRLCGRAPVRDQSVIAKIKETVANGAERRGTYVYICSESDSQREREKQRGREDEKEKERERGFEGVTRQEAILGIGAFD